MKGRISLAKDKKIMVSVTQDQYNLWKEAADVKQVSLPEFIRKAVSVYLVALERKKNLNHN